MIIIIVAFFRNLNDSVELLVIFSVLLSILITALLVIDSGIEEVVGNGAGRD